MKTLFYLGIACFILSSCSSQGTKKEKPITASDTVATTPQPKETKAVGIWDKVSVRATASEDGKWLTSISLGEKLTFLNQEAKDKKEKIYYRIRLNDGTEGWIRHEFIVPNAEPAVFLRDSDIYNRPDLLTKSDIQFSKMDIVALGSRQDDWVEITGKRSGGEWIENGWVKVSSLSTDPVDIAVAKFAKPALDAENKEDKIRNLTEIVQNSDLSGSAFTADIKNVLNDLKMKEIEVSFDKESVQDSVVNVDSEI